MVKISFKKIGRDYSFQPELLKGEFEHSLINKSFFADLRHNWEPYFKLDVFYLAFVYARHSIEMQKTSGFGIKDRLTEASIGWKCFGKFNKDREFYTLEEKYYRDFILKSIKCGRVAAFNRYLESNQCEEILTTNKKHLKINDNGISIIIGTCLKKVFIKRYEIKLEFEKGGKAYQKIIKKDLATFLDKKILEWDISKELQNINKDDFIVLYIFNGFYPSAQINSNSTWPKMESTYPFQKYMSDAVFSLFTTRRWNELIRSAFLSVKCHNPENLIFQLIPIREKIGNPYKNNRLEEINRMRNGMI